MNCMPHGNEDDFIDIALLNILRIQSSIENILDSPRSLLHQIKGNKNNTREQNKDIWHIITREIAVCNA